MHESIFNIEQHTEGEEDTTSSEAEIIYYLYQNDFDEGTYRIIQSCRYVLMEDIIFNPNAPDDITHNVNDNINAWRPYN